MSSEFADDAAFRRAVGDTLRALLDQVDDLDSDDHDPQLSEGNLKTIFESGGTYILSQQTPLHEIWLSAELQAWHFVFAQGQWLERDTQMPMVQVLSQLFSTKLQMDIRFELSPR